MASLPLDDENLPLFTVGQVSSMLAVQQAFLRRLDEHHVVQPSRSAGGQRRYTRREIAVVQYVIELADDGITLSGIRRVLDLDARLRRLTAERDRLAAERGELLRQRNQLLHQRDELAAERDELLAALHAAAARAPAPRSHDQD